MVGLRKMDAVLAEDAAGIEDAKKHMKTRSSKTQVPDAANRQDEPRSDRVPSSSGNKCMHGIHQVCRLTSSTRQGQLASIADSPM